jgi:dihydrofolate synthase/folylpolyglutamate synthase
MKFGLRNIRYLLKASGNPHHCFPAIHVAGTNGKGSTCAFLASILKEAGYLTGLYTSPHLVRFSERIRINGLEIPEDVLAEYVKDLRPSIEAVGATFFEASTCIAFQYFADHGVDVAVIETGLGGRLDATNVLDPVLSIITNVSTDHTEILGSTLQSIAREKGGVIKRGVPCLTGAEETKVIEVLDRIATRRGAPLVRVNRFFRNQNSEIKSGQCSLSVEGKFVSVKQARLGLPGAYQWVNGVTACAGIELLRRKNSPLVVRCTDQTIARGLRRVVENTGLRGRFEMLERNGRFILDVAHNPDAIRVLTRTVQEHIGRPGVVVFGVMKDKDFTTMIRNLAPIARVIVCVSPKTSRALPEGRLRQEVVRQKTPSCKGGTVSKGLTTARRLAHPGEYILVTGSHFVVGEALRHLDVGA